MTDPVQQAMNRMESQGWLWAVRYRYYHTRPLPWWVILSRRTVRGWEQVSGEGETLGEAVMAAIQVVDGKSESC